MIDQDEIDCRLADSYLNGVERGRIEGLERGRIEGLERGREEGIERGREEGLEKNRVDMFAAIESLKKGESAEQVSEELSLPLDFVEQLKGLLDA